MAPPIDLQYFRESDTKLEKVRESQRKRFEDESLVDQIVLADNDCRTSTKNLDTQRRDAALIGKQIATLRKNKNPADELQAKLKSLKLHIQDGEQSLKTKLKDRAVLLSQVGNLVHEDVPVSQDEEENAVISQWGDIPIHQPNLLHHHDLLYRIGGYEPEKGTAISGHRAYFLTGPGVELNMALQAFGIDFLIRRGFEAVQPPYFMNKEAMSKTCQLSQFDEELYHVSGHDDKEGKYLIATSEQPLSALHKDEWMHPSSLPKKYAGVSTCFRKEAGAHGKDAWGIFRVHQFEKVEQFVYAEPEKSWEMHEEMLKISEEFYRELGLPYRVVSIVSGALNNAAAKKYDLEGYFPTLQRYRELVSCSNCTDYQSRALNIRYGQTATKTEKSKKFVHLLNSTLCATTRTICCILENYQSADGVTIPPALRPFCRNKEFIPFTRNALINKSKIKMVKAAAKKQGKKDSENSL